MTETDMITMCFQASVPSQTIKRLGNRTPRFLSPVCKREFALMTLDVINDEQNKPHKTLYVILVFR